MASSCVPASAFESPRRELKPGDLEGLLRRRNVLGLAEMMNFPGVVSGSASELAKLRLARHIDGHAPGVAGKALNAYAAAGIESDHEAATLDEGRERLRAGLWLLIREASSARNLAALLPLVQEYGPHRMAFCTDDREPEHVADDGHINAIVRDAVALGARPEDAIVMASLNPAHLPRADAARARSRRASAPTSSCSATWSRSGPELVLKRGRPRGRHPGDRGARLGQADRAHGSDRAADLAVPWRGGRARVIGLVPDQIITAVARGGADGLRRRRGRGPGPRPGEDRRLRAPPRRRAGSGSGSSTGSGCSAARSARPSPTTRTTSSWSAPTTPRSSPPPTGCATSAAASSSPTETGSSPSCRFRSPGLLSDRPLAEVLDASRKLARRDSPARRHLPAAGADARVPLALGDPGAEDHRPRARRRRAV